MHIYRFGALWAELFKLYNTVDVHTNNSSLKKSKNEYSFQSTTDDK